MHIRTKPRNPSRRRRVSNCHRHPGESVTGFCALCLRDRLAGLEAPVPVPEFRRSKSVSAGKSAGKCEALDDLDSGCRRMSCDVRARNSLSDLFIVDDTKKTRVSDYAGDEIREVKLGFQISPAMGEIRVSDDAGDDIRVSNYAGEDEIRISNYAGEVEIRVSDDDEFELGDLRTMKEILEMELDNNKKMNFWNTASVFSRKLRKWRQKQKEKKQNRCISGETDVDPSKLGRFSQTREVEDYKLGRRSCDTEPRFSIDGHRLLVEDPRISFDEHRASWDGYMVARTIPRLPPLLSAVDNMAMASVNRAATVVEKQQMHSISEDGSGPSVSDCFTSNVGSSSSSSTKTLGLGGDDVKSVSNALVSPANDVIFQGTKLVITEKELKDWHLNSMTNDNIESVSNTPDSSGKAMAANSTSRWKKVCKLWGHKHKVGDKNGDKKNVEDIQENRSVNVVRNNHGLVSLRNRSTRYSTSDLDSGLLRLYLTPFRKSRRNKSVKSRAPSMGISGL
ncbi:protein OCTOPUS-like [Bidens hawaiensis]|uniref:protein OCTOPUS-like n=1 Tax=Bidens hawaiensis TaxID=980011 RepID=UPI00404ADEEE